MELKLSDAGLKLLAILEGCKLKAYKDSAGVWTIGIGTTKYPNRRKVKEGDICTIEQAYEYCKNDIKWCEKAINTLVLKELNQNQFDALVLFVYNIGETAFKDSTALKKINVDPTDRSIGSELLKWNKAGGRPLLGLTNRRQAEIDLYFKKVI